LRQPSGAAVQGELADLSLSGCYVNMLFPIGAGTVVEIGLWMDETTKISLCGVIRTSHPGVGSGVEFVNVTPEQEAALKQLVSKLQPPDA
jgi:hypothetical protein